MAGAGISEQTYYKWRREYGGLKIDQAKRLKELERENERLKKAVSELTLDKLILKEALQVVEQEVKAYCRGKIASYKIPSHVFLVDDSPNDRFRQGPEGEAAGRSSPPP